MTSHQVHVEGLAELRRELKSIDPKLTAGLKEAGLEAARPVAEDARARYRSLGGVNAKAAGSISARGDQRGGIVSARPTPSRRKGSGPIPPGGPEFGGGKYRQGRPSPRGGHTTQFKPHNREGYGIFPAIEEAKDRTVRIYGQMLDKVVDDAFR